jgi:tetratricopeptide (TPR) repeat protein
MMRKALCLALMVGLVSLPLPLPAQTTSTDPDIVRGIAQVDEGDYDAAILTLDNAARRLAQDPKRAGDLSQAYLYLGIAYMGKGHEAAAKAKFREAIGQIKDLTLSPAKFPPKVIDMFEAAKEEAAQAAAQARPATATPAAAPKKKGGSGKVILIVGGLAAAGAIAAAAGGGGGSKTTAPTTTTQPPDPRKTETFTGTLCADFRGGGCQDYYRQYDIVVSSSGRLEAEVTWTNGAVFFSLNLDDDNYQTISRSNRITNTSSQLSADVSPRTSSPDAAYRLYIYINNASAAENYNLTVKHP